MSYFDSYITLFAEECASELIGDHDQFCSEFLELDSCVYAHKQIDFHDSKTIDDGSYLSCNIEGYIERTENSVRLECEYVFEHNMIKDYDLGGSSNAYYGGALNLILDLSIDQITSFEHCHSFYFAQPRCEDATLAESELELF